MEGVHNVGTPVSIQINHAGEKGNVSGMEMERVGPSETESARRLEVDEIKDIVGDFAKAAERAEDAGVDAVEIHGAHGFLLNQFYSPLTNDREDEYGGSFEGRVKLPVEVVDKVNESLDETALLYRLGAVDLDPRGNGIEDSMKLARILAESGVDVLDVSGGICGDSPKKLEGRQGYFVPQASKIKGEVDVPVIGVGGITEASYADKIVREGCVDLVAVGRAQLSDPNWAEKAVEELTSN